MSPVYRSHFGVYALILRGGKVLLVKKALGCYTGLYDLPGGSMEPQELLEETLRREVLEETDCTVTRARQLCALSTLYPHEEDGQEKVLRHLGVIYLAEIEGTPRAHGAGDDSDGCIWLPVEEVTLANAAPFVVDALKEAA